MTTFRMNIAALLMATLLVVGCASILHHKDSDQMLQNQEYDNAVHIKEITPAAGPSPGGSPGVSAVAITPLATPAPALAPAKSLHHKKKKPVPVSRAETLAKTPLEPIVGKKEPDVESAAGFTGRRPDKDPFRVGESTTMELSYFGAVAGVLKMDVLPYVEVNGRKSYHLKAMANSTSVFSMFYAIDDAVDTFLAFDTMLPSSYKLAVKESKQLRDTREYFDWDKLKGFYWDKKITSDKGLQEKKIEWPILAYSQNLISAPYYLRTFKLEPGQSYKYRVAYEGKNMVVTADVLRRETIDTELGPMKAVVVKPSFQIDGVFSPTGEILFWMSDDDRHFFLRIESKIKIGKIVGQVKKIEKGEP